MAFQNIGNSSICEHVKIELKLQISYKFILIMPTFIYIGTSKMILLTNLAQRKFYKFKKMLMAHPLS